MAWLGENSLSHSCHFCVNQHFILPPLTKLVAALFGVARIWVTPSIRLQIWYRVAIPSFRHFQGLQQG